MAFPAYFQYEICLGSPASSSIAPHIPSQEKKLTAVWLPVLFLKGDVIYPQNQTLQSAGAECSTDTSK